MHSYNDHPALAVWETTQTRNAGRRTRGRTEANAARLDTSVARSLLESLAAAHVPELVLTGGDPGKRPDLLGLVAYGRSLGIQMVLLLDSAPIPAPRLIDELVGAGLSRLAVGLHGHGVVGHEALSGIAGGFEGSLSALRHAHARGIATEVVTTVHAGNVARLARIADVVELVEATLWNVSYLVPTAPAEVRLLPTAEAVARSLDLLLEEARSRPFAVKTSHAPNYPRHVAAQRASGVPPTRLGKGDERSSAFVSHGGNIFPDAMLPVQCGNVKTDDLLEVYRHHLVFRLLRTPDMLGGKCRVCGYRQACAGSRARAYAMAQSLTAQDPLCTYAPPSYGTREEQRSVQ